MVAALTWMVLSWVEHKKPSALATATGAVCGLVAITPASGYVGPIASIAINAAGNNGLLFGNSAQLVTQLIAVGVTASYAFIATYILLKILNNFMPLRVKESEEKEGLDLSLHGEAGYRF